MAKPKVLMSRCMPYTTMLNRARQFRALGWEPYLIYREPPANSDLFINIGRVFEGVWSYEFLLSSAGSAHDFVQKRGFDLLYTIGPPDSFNANFTGVPCPWIQDFRDLMFLITPKADDFDVLEKVIEETKAEIDYSATCAKGSDFIMYVSPWQMKKGQDFLWPRGDVETAAGWLPNIPFHLPEIKKDPDLDPGVVRWGYTGSMQAAWSNAASFFGQVQAELDSLGTESEFHTWSFMQMHDNQPMEWFRVHETLEQHDMIAEMGSILDYGLIAPPTKSDGLNAPTGWPGKLGDYIAAGVTAFVPENFMCRGMLKRKGWGFGYNSPKDIARIINTSRKPDAKRAQAPHLQNPVVMNVLESAIAKAQSEYRNREVKPIVAITVPPIKDLVVMSDGNRHHAEGHIAPILGADFSQLIEPTVNIGAYKTLYILGVWCIDEPMVAIYEQTMGRFERILIQWAGSDVKMCDKHPIKEKLLKLLADERIVHMAPNKALAEEIEKLTGRPVSVINTPSRNVYEKPFPMPRQFAVSCYYPSLNPKQYTESSIEKTRDLYGLDVVDEAIERMKDVPFYLHHTHPQEGKLPDAPNVKVLGSIDPVNYPEFLKNVSVLLRMTSHDGTPYSMIEHVCAGRYAIMQQSFPFTKTVERDPVEIVKALNSVRETRRPNQSGANYWRMYNDHDRFRTRIRGLIEKGVNEEVEAVPFTLHKGVDDRLHAEAGAGAAV